MIALVIWTLVAIWARAEMFALVDYLVIVDIVSFYCPTLYSRKVSPHPELLADKGGS